MSPANFYVYYRADPAQRALLEQAVARLFAAVERRSGVRGRWMQRDDDARTFMEVYEAVADPAGFRHVLEEEARDAGLARFLLPDSRRHTDVFVAA